MARLWGKLKRHLPDLAIALFAGFLGVALASPQDQDKVNSDGSNALQEMRVEREYDRFQSSTTFSVKTDLPEAKACDESAIRSAELWAVHVCKGNVQSCPAAYVAINFYFITSTWVFQDAGITLLVDGTRVPLTSAKWKGSLISARSLRESFGPVVPVAIFRKMAQAKVIEVQIGSCEFAMNGSNLASFQAISKKINAAPRALTSPKMEPKGSIPKKADGAKHQLQRVGEGKANVKDL